MRNNKSQISNNKQIPMTKIQNHNVFVIEYWNLRFTLRLAQGGELVEPFVIWCLESLPLANGPESFIIPS
jgi:hypothetical protein